MAIIILKLYKLQYSNAFKKHLILSQHGFIILMACKFFFSNLHIFILLNTTF